MRVVERSRGRARARRAARAGGRARAIARGRSRAGEGARDGRARDGDARNTAGNRSEVEIGEFRPARAVDARGARRARVGTTERARDGMTDDADARRTRSRRSNRRGEDGEGERGGRRDGAMSAEGGLPGQPPASEVAAVVSDGKVDAGAGDGNEVQTATPALSPGQGANGSPNSDKTTKDGEVANEAPARTPAPALAVSSPTTIDVEVPTPRGVDQMSPDGNREYKIYKDIECCFCGAQKKFNGYLAFKKHVVSYCSAKPEETFAEYQQHVEKYWAEQPAMDQAEMVSAFVMEDENDKDETDRDSDADDDGPRSDTVKHRAEAEATHNADSDDDRPANKAALLKTPENLFDDVSNVDDKLTANESTEPNRKRRTAARPSRYTVGIDDEDERAASRGRDIDKSTNESQECACTECGKSFKNAHSLKIHQSKMKHRGELIVPLTAGAVEKKNKTQASVIVTNHSTACDVCGVSVKSPAGLVTHKARWCKGAKSAATSVPNAQVVTKATDKAPPKIASEAHTPLKELSVGAKSRKCLLREESGCEFKGTSFDDLVRHMQVEHGVKVTRIGKQSAQGESPGDEPAVEEQSVRPQTETTILRIFHTQRSCAECSAKFPNNSGLIAHYKDAHNVRAFITAKEFKEAEALMNSSSDASLPTSEPKPSLSKPNKLTHETRDTDRPSGKSKKTQITCEYCQTYTGFWNAGFAAHLRSCKLKHPQTSPLEEEPLNVGVNFPGPPRTKEMDPGVRFCDECAAGDFKCKSFRQLCTHYKKEHNVELIAAAAVIEDRVALNQTDMEEVDETVVHDKGVHSSTKHMEILTDQLQCPECEFKAKQHRGLCTHMRMKHKTIPIPVEPPSRRKRSRAASVTAEDETHALVPVKRMTRELDDALPGNEIVEVKNFQQLVNSFKELSAAHKELVRSHEELARSHEIATRTNVQYEDRIAVLESGTSQGGDRRRGAGRGALALHAPDANTQVVYHNPGGLDCSPVVTWGRQVWLSGITCGGVVEPTFTGQMRRVFDNLVRLLVMAGTDVAHLLQVKIHLKDIREMEAVCDIWDRFFSDAGITREHRPCRHITQAVLSNAKLQVEMFAEAVLPGEGEQAFPSGLPPKRIANA